MKSIRTHINGPEGNTLVYIVVVMLIFGTLGVTMVSLFSSSTVSSATRNDARRALYMAESGTRYAISEIRNSDFDSDIIDTLNTTTYTVNGGGRFTINVFGPWFESLSDQSQSAGLNLTLNVPEGNLPQDFSVPPGPPYVSVVNWEYIDIATGGATAQVQGFTRVDDKTLNLNLGDSFTVNSGEKVCLAVKPSEDQSNIVVGGSLRVASEAIDIFPRKNGAIDIRRKNYFYEELTEGSTWVELTNLSSPSPTEDFPFDVVAADDYVILSPLNHRIIPSGTSGEVTTGVSPKQIANIYDHTPPLLTGGKPDIEFAKEDLDTALSQVETDAGFIDVDNVAKTVNVGGGYSPPSGTAFGAAWYAGTKAIGGDDDFCQTGECLFGLGIRVFFTLEYSGAGAGVTFALINGASNNSSSVGGDAEFSEYLGYAGDSRLDPAGTEFTFLDGTQNGAGLNPPKMALEFDTQTNNANLAFCSGTDLNPDTRNDPLSNNKDAVQFVFWGRENNLNIPCRNNDPSYDDNRHDPDGESGEQKWAFSTGADVISSPAVGADGTIYVGSVDGHLYAINPDGSQKWRYPSTGNVGDIRSSPAVDPDDGTIYVGAGDPNVGFDGRVLALNPSGTLKWQFIPSRTGEADNDVESSPALDSSGKIYIGADDSTLYALDPDDRLAGRPFPTANEWAFETAGDVESTPAIDEMRSTVYVESESLRLHAVDMANGSPRWEFDLGGISDDGEMESSPAIDDNGTPADRTDDAIYVGSKDGHVYAINPEDGSSRGLSWPFNTGGAVRSSPTVGVDRTIYVGSNDGHLYALNPDGTEKWVFPATGSI
ncbi:MAG: PQQ-like beta-propeller repeat protein, partial [Desulfobacterales bacterium]